MSVEYRIVWKWIPKWGVSKERTKIYKTEKGAKRFYSKITSNNGVFLKTDDGWDGENHGIFYEKWVLDYAKLQIREVTDWSDV